MKFINSTCAQLNRFYKENKDKARAKPDDLMFAAIDENQQVCAVLRLLPYAQFYFLRSVLTSPESRGEGIASTLIQYAIDSQFAQAENTPIYTLPTPLALPLYSRLGFTAIEQADIPVELQSSYRRFRHANNDSSVMVIRPAVG